MQASRLLSRRGRIQRRSGLIFTLTAILFVGIPFWLTYREVQRAKASVALIAAIKRQNTPAALAALDAGANPNAVENEQSPTLSQVLRDWWNRLRGQQPVRKKQRTALVLALPHTEDGSLVGWKDSRLIKALLEKGADANVSADFNVNSKFGLTPLTISIMTRDETVEHLLVEHGADVNARMRSGETELMIAAMFGEVNIAKDLLQHGADVHAKDSRGFTAMQYAITIGNDEMIALLKQTEEGKLSSSPGSSQQPVRTK